MKIVYVESFQWWHKSGNCCKWQYLLWHLDLSHRFISLNSSTLPLSYFFFLWLFVFVPLLMHLFVYSFIWLIKTKQNMVYKQYQSIDQSFRLSTDVCAFVYRNKEQENEINKQTNQKKEKNTPANTIKVMRKCCMWNSAVFVESPQYASNPWKILGFFILIFFCYLVCIFLF